MTQDAGMYDPVGQPRHRVHFARAEFGLYIEHSPNMSADEIIGRIRSRELFPNSSEIQFDAERVITFNRDGRAVEGQPQTFSLVFARVNNPAMRDELSLLDFVDSLNQRISDQQLDRGEFRIRQATANWLSAGAPEPDGSGGPGGKPVAPLASGVPGLQILPIELPPELGLTTDPAKRGACTDIFILDTAPCEVDLKRAYRKWVEQPLRNTNPQPDDPQYNHMLDNLIGPNGALGYIYESPQIEYAGYTHLLELANAFLPDHDYVMGDHGLFVASIINRIAPAARLHLVEVLNPYGVGTLESIVRGFARAANFALENTCAVVLVNASLFLEVAPADLLSLETLAKVDPFWQRVRETRAGLITAWVEPFKTVCDFLRRQSAQVLAAAGNDGTEETDATGSKKQIHPVARFPAAFESVVGVAALNYAGDLAPYSNEADIPVSDGLAAIGGDKTGDTTDPNRGVLGLYIGSFPDGTPNKHGLARWSGTSFSTPVITGLFAALACEGITPGDALNHIQSKLNNQSAGASTTEVFDS